MKLLADVLRYAEPPEDRMVTCPECGEKWTNLPGGLCCNCKERQEQEEFVKSGRLREVVLEGSGVPERLRRKFIEPDSWPRPRPGDGDVAEWAGKPELLTFSGPTEAGKSMLAAELLYRNGGGKWVSASSLPDLKINDWPRWEALKSYPRPLVVDELGRGHNRDAWEYVYGIVGARWDDCKPTIVTTNLDLAALGDETTGHPPLARRLGEGWWVPLGKVWSER